MTSSEKPLYPYKLRIDDEQCITCGQWFIPFQASAKKFCSHACRCAFYRQDPEPAPVEGARWIPLGNARFSLVDEADFARVNAFTWSDDGRSGAHVFYDTIGGQRYSTRLRLHQFVLGLSSEAIVDHKNGDELDNRRKNLRAASPGESSMNRRKRWRRAGQAPLSPFKGVWKAGNRWMAMVTAYGKRHYAGCYATQEEAACAHDAKAREVHGEFACVNFPREGERGAVR